MKRTRIVEISVISVTRIGYIKHREESQTPLVLKANKLREIERNQQIPLEPLKIFENSLLIAIQQFKKDSLKKEVRINPFRD